MTTTLTDAPKAETPSRAKDLRAATHGAHDRLDKRIMAAAPFADRARYGRFLLVQYAFHRDIDALYDNAMLDGLLPDLPGRRRVGQIQADLTDLGIAIPAIETPPHFAAGAEVDLPAALGWLYVAEGSNLGAAFLLKEALKLDLNEGFGARHLAGAPEGRGLHWRTFTAALDAVTLSDAENERVIANAVAAFDRVRGLVNDHMPLPAEAV
ncbi:biliverdin-producing heme oxygenase [Hyphomicrobium sp. D-2]|uniref:biliverdin-producing heme oxygenase n=1 Tax=Hyphomicrobium sp. D-2 TaxID=3041621 RepID=UPI0024561A4D|nr:biliverdin-producing heme oxygenase [Hyphomicrobium sp. D-2]MDH4983722.1 biliverdin-producing heme oxygenase [Hyphomicrobium sp. D-2]